MATKKPQITAYLTDEVNKALDQEAAKERRSRSQMVALLLEEALRARGYELTSDDEEVSK
ncbi:MAG: ribbon-helix-helix protein, CopG family [Leptolyngbyaceae cyanobacterium RM1_406_9]|nr:ribbon-helix-helix protein, CopG family [Leptolyngbyaceae cyanobacterium RM1_406_9]